MSRRIPSQIEVTNDCIIIRHLEIRLYDAVESLQQLREYEYEDFCRRAFEIGLLCLQGTHTRNELEFIQLKFDSLLNDLYDAVDKIPNTLELKLSDKIGTGEGQLLAPIQRQIHLTTATLNAKLSAVSNFLSQEFNPSQETSVFGSAVQKIQNLLDEKRSDSLQGIFTTAIANVTADNGTLAKAVKAVVNESVKPLAEQVEKLALQIKKQELIESVLEQTIAKGATYEDIVLKDLQVWAKTCGAEIYYVGAESSPGDILIKFTPSSFVGTDIAIILEARNRESERWGRTKISRHLETAMAQHKANAAIFLSSTMRGLGKDVYEFGQGECESGSWVATHHEMLHVALQFLILRHRLKSQLTSNLKIDCASIEAQLQQIESSLKHITNINACLTQLDKITDGIREQSKGLRNELRSALNSIRNSISRT